MYQDLIFLTNSIEITNISAKISFPLINVLKKSITSLDQKGILYGMILH